MYKLDLLKLDPVAHILIAVVIALEVYASFFQWPDAGELIELKAMLAACSR